METVLRAAKVGLLGAVFASASYAADWPDKPIRVVVPYGAGGGVDVFTRPLAANLTSVLGQPVIVDNRPGAGGIIGVRNAATSTADGYTFLSGGVHQPMAEGLYSEKGYDLDKDFVPVSINARVPTVLVINPSAPFKTVPEFMSYARAHPDKINYCSSGNGTSQHIVGEMFKKMTGISLMHIPYKGTAPAMTDLIAGQCMLMFDGLGTSAQQIRGGKILLLAVVGPQRSALFPEAPTLKEAGGPDFDATIWYGWWARRGTPEPIIKSMAQAIDKSLKSPNVAEAWQQQGAEVPNMPFEQVGPYVHKEILRWVDTVHTLGITVN